MDFRNKKLLSCIHRGTCTCKIIMPKLHFLGLCFVDTTYLNSIKNNNSLRSFRYYNTGHHHRELPWYSVIFRLDNHHTELPWKSVRNYSSGHHHKKPPAHSDTYLYDVLHVSSTATQAQIKNAYFKLSKLYHPDVNKSEEAVKVFHEISEAYEVLGNVRKRRLYDRGIMPSDLRSEHHGQESSEVHGHGFRRQNFTPRHKQPLTGRTHIYNFDEFYRKHYGELREKEAMEMLKGRVKRRVREQHQENEEENHIFRLVCFVCVGILVLNFFVKFVLHDPGAPVKNKNK